MNRKARRAQRARERRGEKSGAGGPARPASSPSGAVLMRPDTTLGSFFWEQERHLHRHLESGHLAILAPLMERVYEAAFAALPTPHDLFLWHLLALCHRAFLVGVGTIARGQPDDAAAPTRRALEMAKLAIAVQYDSKNAEEWAAYKRRLARWEARAQSPDTVPPPLRPSFSLPKGHELLNEIGRSLGVLSDSAVHFTPEYLGEQELRQVGGHLLAAYFVSTPADDDRWARVLAGEHLRVLRAFDEAFVGASGASEPFRVAITAVGSTGERLAAATGVTVPPRDAPAG